MPPRAHCRETMSGLGGFVVSLKLSNAGRAQTPDPADTKASVVLPAPLSLVLQHGAFFIMGGPNWQCRGVQLVLCPLSIYLLSVLAVSKVFPPFSWAALEPCRACFLSCRRWARPPPSLGSTSSLTARAGMLLVSRRCHSDPHRLLRGDPGHCRAQPTVVNVILPTTCQPVFQVTSTGLPWAPRAH